MCDFCEKKAFIPMEFRGGGIGTMADNIHSLFGGMFSTQKPSGSGVQLEEDNGGYFLKYDNSANEYGDGYLPIHYCPLCGRKIKEDADV